MNNLQQLLMACLLILSITSCKKSAEKTNENNGKTETGQEATLFETKSSTEGTYLCKINGKDWIYTKASGIVSRHKKSNKRTAMITFTNKMDKGSESVQLFYDGDTYQLEKATAELKQPKKDGGRMSALYQLMVEGGNRLPDSEISGTLDLSNKTVAAGTADVKNMKIRFEVEQLEDQSMAVITLSPLSFEGIGYSNLDKLKYDK